MKNGMNKKVMMLHELQTPPVSSNLSSLRKQEQGKEKVYRLQATFFLIYLICLHFIRKETTAILSPF